MFGLGDVFGSKRRKGAIDEKRLAFYMGYAFSDAIHVQHLLTPVLWKTHSQACKDGPCFMAEFKRSILAQPFGQQCMECIDNAEPVQFVS